MPKFKHYESGQFIAQAQNCLYNSKGLQRYFSALWMKGIKADGVTGCGGIDIVCIGDSYTEGSGLTNDVQGFGINDNGHVQAWPNRLRKIIQPAMNPAGVAGGHGFFMADKGSGSSARTPTGATSASAGLWCEKPFSGWNGSSGEGGGYARQLCTFNHTAGQRYVLYDFNVAEFPITHIQMCGAASGVCKVDISLTPGNSNPIAIGAGTQFAGTLTLDGGTDFWGAVSNIGNVTAPSANWRLQVYNQNSSSEIFLSGFMIYNGDTTCGVRVHNMGSASSSADMWANEDTQSLAGMANLGRSAADGSTTYPGQNARLVIIMLGANDWGGTKAAFKTDIQAILDLVLAWTSAPAVLLVAQTPRYDGAADLWTSVQPFHDALYEICDNATYSAKVALLDMWKFYNNLRPQRIAAQYGAINTNDSVHPSISGHGDIAKAIAACVVPRSLDLALP
jgi:lysophospholipase L1-like esterase